MLRIKNITMKNFMSVGAVTQTLNLNNSGFTLILGENLDQGGNGARNGVGKSVILQALCYALYNTGITLIKKDNLINKTNSKGMVICVEFEINNIEYKVVRGRRPNIFEFYINDAIVQNKNDAQGENVKTQFELERVLGMSSIMFKNIVLLNTYSIPFLQMRTNEQRVVIEELLGITLLSEKALQLKELIKEAKDIITKEEYKIKAISDSNATIQKSIDNLVIKSRLFENNKKTSIVELIAATKSLEEVDISNEIKNHKQLQKFNQIQSNLLSDKQHLSSAEKTVIYFGTNINRLEVDIKKVEEDKCPTCKQELKNDETHSHILKELQKEYSEIIENLDPAEENLFKYKKLVSNSEELLLNFNGMPQTFYNIIDDAYNHQQSLREVVTKLASVKEENNPFLEQLTSLNENIKQILYTKINDLKKNIDHQEFLLRLLTSKDSFIRKKIIEQNLGYLNSRLSYYLSKFGLPHQVTFQNDLSVEILLLGHEFDFGQLSRGQQTRLNLASSLSFRDVWESTCYPINLLFIDEMIDNGIDSQGAEAALSVLKKMSRERNKDIFLISHKEELISRVNNVLMVIYENGFTSFNIEEEIIDG